MSGSTILRRETLANGLVLEFRDLSNRYFGDYHRVRLELRLILDLATPPEGAGPELAPLLDSARGRFGKEVVEVRSLERMGVAGESLPQVCASLVDDFLKANIPYFQHPGYLERWLTVRLQEKGRRRFPFSPA